MEQESINIEKISKWNNPWMNQPSICEEAIELANPTKLIVGINGNKFEIDIPIHNEIIIDTSSFLNYIIINDKMFKL